MSDQPQRNVSEWYELGRECLSCSHYEDAINAFTSALETSVTTDQATYAGEVWHLIYHLRGLAYYRSRCYEEALADFSKAIEIYPSAEAYYHRGVCQLDLEQFSDALEDLTQAIQLNPQDPMAWNERGVARIHLRDVREAISDFQSALEVDPNYEQARINLARAIGH